MFISNRFILKSRMNYENLCDLIVFSFSRSKLAVTIKSAEDLIIEHLKIYFDKSQI